MLRHFQPFENRHPLPLVCFKEDKLHCIVIVEHIHFLDWSKFLSVLICPSLFIKQYISTGYLSLCVGEGHCAAERAYANLHCVYTCLYLQVENFELCFGVLKQCAC